MGRRVLGSVVATLSGWIVGWVLLTVYFCFINGFFRHPDWSFAAGMLLLFPEMGFLILPAWALMVLPIYLRVTKAGLFSNLYFSVPFGAMAGFFIIQALRVYQTFPEIPTGREAFDVESLLLSIPAVIVGATTGLVGVLTRRWFLSP